MSEVSKKSAREHRLAAGRRRWLGLLAVTAISLFVLPAAASAATTATTLCKVSQASCETANRLPAGTAIEASLKTGTLFKASLGFVTAECSGSTITGKTTAEYGIPLPLEVTAVSLSGCKGCTSPSVKNLPYSGTAEQTSGTEARVGLKSSGKGEPRITFTGCPLSQTCIYGAGELALNLTGGNPGALAAKETAMEKKEGSNSLCGATAKVNATYELTSPNPVYASRVPLETALCKESVNPCPAASAYGKGTALEASLQGELKFEFGGFFTMTCTGAEISGETTGGPGATVPVQFTLGALAGCKGCSSIKWLHAPYKSSLSSTGVMTADLEIEFSGCTLGTSCRFDGNVPFEVKGGNPATISIKEEWLGKDEGTSNCGESLHIGAASWSVSSPKPLWIETYVT
jgi:uncharacterized OsmC-like protein